ncbi:unnamed protein product [Linum trigynum]
MEIDKCRDPIPLPRRRGRSGRAKKIDQGTTPAAALEHKGKSATRRTLQPSSDVPSLEETDEASRRHRLILEDESEEEFVVQHVPVNRQKDDRPPLRQSAPCVLPTPQLPRFQAVPTAKLKDKKKGEHIRPGPNRTNGPAQLMQLSPICQLDPKAKGRMGKSNGGLA